MVFWEGSKLFLCDYKHCSPVPAYHHTQPAALYADVPFSIFSAFVHLILPLEFYIQAIGPVPILL